MKFSMTVLNGNELARRLEALPEALTKAILLEALTAAAEPIRSTAATLAPRGPGPGPHLADHIGISRGKTGHSVAIGPTHAKKDSETEDYAVRGLMQEFGTVRHGAQSFLRPAFDAHGQTALSILQQRLWTALRKAAGKTTDPGTIGQGRL